MRVLGAFLTEWFPGSMSAEALLWRAVFHNLIKTVSQQLIDVVKTDSSQKECMELLLNRN